MRAVLDTNILVSAFLFGGTPLELVSLAEQGVIEVVTSEGALAELLAVLSRRRFAPRLGELDMSPEMVVVAYGSIASIVEPREFPGICRDSSDDAFIAIAVAGEADVIVSGDRHLLGCSERSPVPVVTAAEFLAVIRKATREEP